MEAGILEIDIHGLNQQQAQKAIDVKLRKASAGVYRIRIIHGFHGGTSLKEMIQREYRNHEKVIRLGLGNNQGETFLILREF